MILDESSFEDKIRQQNRLTARKALATGKHFSKLNTMGKERIEK